MAVKVANTGLFTIPTGPSVGTGVLQNASANTYSSVFVQLQASGALGASYITGVSVNITTSSSLHTGKYVDVQIATGASGSETVVGNVNIPTPGIVPAANAKYGGIANFQHLPIAVAANTRIACKTASDTAAALSWNVSLQAVLQANVVTDTNVNDNVNVINVNGTAQTARDLGLSVLLSSGTGTGQVSLVSGTVALSSTAPVYVSSGTGTGQVKLNSGNISVVDTVTTVTGLTASNLDATISSRSTYGGTDTSGTTTLLTRLSTARATNLDNLNATISSRLASTDFTTDVNIASVNNITVNGTGQSTDPWGP